MKKGILAGVVSVCVMFSSGVLAVPMDNNTLASLINDRLSYMKDVAGYKAKNRLAIENLPQESRVLSESVAEAKALGLDGGSVTPFIQAQMDAAKAIQYRYRADWLSVPEKHWQPESLDQVRLKISKLNRQILEAISLSLRGRAPLMNKEAFMRTLQQVNLNVSDKERLWRELSRVKLRQG